MRRRGQDDTIQRLERSYEFLRASVDGPTSLKAAAGVACMSPYHFHRTFRNAFGETPHELVARLRLDRARRLLLESDLSVTEICFDIGFQSLGTFSSTFARQVGCSPSEFRLSARRVWALSGWRTHRLVPACFVAPRPVR